MNRFKLFIIFSVTIAYVSCFKDAEHEYSFPNDGLKIKTVTEDVVYPDSQRVQHIYTYSYDSIGRIKGIDSDSSYVTFKYSTNLTQKNIYPIVGLAQHYYYYFNNDGRLDSTIWFTESTGDTSHIVYTYGTDSLLVKRRVEKVISSPGVLKSAYQYEYRYDDKGNVEGITGYSGRNDIIYESHYVYADSANVEYLSEQISPDAIKNPNLLKQSVSKFGADPVSLTNYSYAFDTYGRIDQMREQSSSVGVPYFNLYSYTYY